MRTPFPPSFSFSSLIWLWSLLFALLTPASVLAAAEDTLVIQPAHADFFIDVPYYSVLEDSTGQLTLQDVEQPAVARQFATCTGPPNITNTASAYWLRFTVHNADHSGTHWYLDLFDSHTNDLQFFQPTPTGYQRFLTGADRPFASRLHPYKDFLFDLRVAPGQTETYYLRLKSNSKTSFRAMLRSEPVSAFPFSGPVRLAGGLLWHPVHHGGVQSVHLSLHWRAYLPALCAVCAELQPAVFVGRWPGVSSICGPLAAASIT